LKRQYEETFVINIRCGRIILPRQSINCFTGTANNKLLLRIKDIACENKILLVKKRDFLLLCPVTQ
jgi:hypothetical protein